MSAPKACRFPNCGSPGVGVCVLCSEHVCAKHVPKHFLVRPYGATSGEMHA